MLAIELWWWEVNTCVVRSKFGWFISTFATYVGKNKFLILIHSCFWCILPAREKREKKEKIHLDRHVVLVDFEQYFYSGRQRNILSLRKVRIPLLVFEIAGIPAIMATYVEIPDLPKYRSLHSSGTRILSSTPDYIGLQKKISWNGQQDEKIWLDNTSMLSTMAKKMVFRRLLKNLLVDYLYKYTVH